MTVSWCRCGRYHWFAGRCTLPPKRCLHEWCQGERTCKVIEGERT